MAVRLAPPRRRVIAACDRIGAAREGCGSAYRNAIVPALALELQRYATALGSRGSNTGARTMISRWMKAAVIGLVVLCAALAHAPARAEGTLPPGLAQQLETAAGQGQDALIAAVKDEVAASPSLAAEIAGYATKLMPDAGALILTAVLDVLPPDLAYQLTPEIVAAVERNASGSLVQFHLPNGGSGQWALPPAENPTPTVASPS
jgi:hypothetical protein